MTTDIKQLGRYQIKGVLGKGAMGLVYEGVDPNLDRKVAIKTILTKNLDESMAKHYAMRFQKEVRAVARLNHGNIVQVYDFGTEGDLAYIVMELIEGKELKDALDAKQPFDLRTVFKLMCQVLDALHFAHEAGVIHRDIKPANVMIDSAGNAKLADFGVARVEDPDGGGEATRVGTVLGTPSYMSPEQTQGQPVDRRTDIFSAGILFYHMLTGQKPFEGVGFALSKKIIMDDPVWPSQLCSVPPVIDRVVQRALAKEADERYQSAKAFADALRRILEGKQPEDPNEAPKKPGPAAAPAGAPSAAETEFWNEIKDSTDPDEIGLYLEQFPTGAYAAQARGKIAGLKGEAPAAEAAGQPAPAASAEGTEAEKEFWNEIKDSTDPDEIGLYLDQFPTGAYATIARRKIAELGKK